MIRGVRLGALLAAVQTLSAAAGFSIEEFSRSFAFSPRGCIFLENLNGDVRITSWDRDEVRVEAVKRALTPDRLDDAHIVVNRNDDTLSIRTQYAPGTDEPASVEYRIMVPRRARLRDVKLVNGGLSIYGVAGDVKASAVNGNIHAEQLEGEAELSTVNGQLEAGFQHLPGARAISLTSVNGPITLTLPAEGSATVNARNLAGGIRSDYGHPLRIASSGGHRLRTFIRRGKGGMSTRIQLHNVNGGISITGPARVPAGC